MAPATAIFFSKEWERISDKRDLLTLTNDITGILERVLLQEA
jgi:hypothetical protein